MLPRFLARVVELAALLLFIAALCSPAHAQTVIVSGNLKNIIGGNITANAWVRLELQNCGGNWPVVAGSLLVQSRYDLKPDGSGNISQGVYPNQGAGAITCAGQPTTFYNATRYLNNSAVGAPVPLIVFGGSSLDLDTAPTCGTPVTASCQLISTPTGPIAVGSTGPAGALVCAAGTCGTNGDFNVAGFLTSKAFMTTRIASQYPGATLAEQANAAAASLSTTGGTVYVPAGTYVLSAPENWPAYSFGNSMTCGIQLPSNVWLQIDPAANISVTWGASSPDAAVICNLNGNVGNSNIRVSGGNFTVTNNRTPYGPFTSVIMCSICTGLEVDHVIFNGNPNSFIKAPDTQAFNIHDNEFNPNGTASGKGDSAISGLGAFGGTMPYLNQGGKIHDNRFYSLQNLGGQSLIAQSQSNVEIYDNRADLISKALVPGSIVGSPLVETGIDNFGRLPSNVNYHDNFIYGGAGFFPTLMVNGEIVDNKMVCPWSLITNAALCPTVVIAAAATGLGVTGSSIRIAGNHIIGGGSIKIFQSGISEGVSHVTVTDNELDGGCIAAVSGGYGSDYTVTNNTVLNSMNGNLTNGCIASLGAAIVINGQGSVINNRVIRPGAGSRSNAGNVGFRVGDNASGVSFTPIFANNQMIDDQTVYTAGTIGSVATATGGACSGTSRYLALTGGTWSQTWTNRYIFIGGETESTHIVRGILDATHLELETAVSCIAGGTSYAFDSTAAYGFVVIHAVNSFTNNIGIVSAGVMAGSGAMINETGLAPSVTNIAGNYFSPYACNSCVAGRVYQAIHTSTGSCTLGTNCAAIPVTFTSNATYDCFARDATTPANAVTIALTSGTAFALTGTGTDVLHWSCTGY